MLMESEAKPMSPSTTKDQQGTSVVGARVPAVAVAPAPGRVARQPVTRDLTLAYVATLLVAVVVATVSAAGLLFGPAGLYGAGPPVAADVTVSTAGILVPGFLAHDALNLAVAL